MRVFLSANASFQKTPNDPCMILIYMNEKKECQGDIPSLDIFSEEKNDAAGEKETLAGIMARLDCIKYGSKK